MTNGMKTGFRIFQVVIFSALLLVLGSVIGFRVGKGQSVPVITPVLGRFPQFSRLINTEKPQDFSKVDFTQFWDVWRRLENNYVDPEKLDSKKMVHGAIQGMTNAIGDPYTVYLPPDDQKRSAEDLQGAFDGVGIQLGYRNQTLAVMAPLKGMPAEKAGVMAGDYILHIRDEKKAIDRDTTGLSLPEAVNLIRGQKGSIVYLTFMKEGGKPEEKALERDTILVPSVELKFVEKDGTNIAHLMLSKFGDRTQDEWDEAVRQILEENKKQTLKGIVLDVRNNPGGYLQTAVDLASDFIDKGLVVTQQGRYQSERYTTTRKARLFGIPVVALVNKGTASAAEILSGAIRDQNKVKIVGETTFGKGTVQDAMSDFRDGAGLHVTIAKWLLPSGDWIHEKGITPEVEVTDNIETVDVDEAFEKAMEVL